MREFIVIITMEPQSAHDSGIQHNHQRQWKKENHIPCGGIRPAHPLLWEDIRAEIAVLVLQDIFDNKHRRDKQYGENPTKGNNHLKLNTYRFISILFHPKFSPSSQTFLCTCLQPSWQDLLYSYIVGLVTH